MAETEGRAAYMREWRAGVGKSGYEIAKGQQRARNRVLRRLAQQHRDEFNKLYAAECIAEGVPVPATTL